MTNIAETDYNDKGVDGVLGTQTHGGRMVGADKSTELWRHTTLPTICFVLLKNNL